MTLFRVEADVSSVGAVTVHQQSVMYTAPPRSKPTAQPQVLLLPSADKSHALFAALLVPDKDVYGPGPYPTAIQLSDSEGGTGNRRGKERVVLASWLWC